MNRMIVMLMFLASTSVALAAMNAETNAPARPKHYPETGGFVVKPAPGNGRVLIANAQKRVGSGALASSVRYFQFHAKMSLETSEVDTAIAKNPDVGSLQRLKATLAVFVIDNPDCAATIRVMPDEHFAIVNVSALDGDKPGEEVLTQRTTQAINRAICFLCGGGGSRYPNTLAGPFKDPIKDYGRFTDGGLPPDVFPRISNYLNTLGVKPIVRTTYREACEQGWAPKPADEFQKAIWESVHAIPTNPIKIKFDPKRDK